MKRTVLLLLILSVMIGVAVASEVSVSGASPVHEEGGGIVPYVPEEANAECDGGNCGSGVDLPDVIEFNPKEYIIT